MKKIVFASHNQNKVNELRKLISGYNILSLSDIDWNEEIEETGSTLHENSLLKAMTVFRKTGEACFADDTGLEVQALNAAPGVYSARYAGEPANSENNMAKLLEALEGKENRKARFKTVITLVNSAQEIHYFEGLVEGEISLEKIGEQGFGYDPIFIPKGYSKSFAQMAPETKNEISHRGRAVAKLVSFLKS